MKIAIRIFAVLTVVLLTGCKENLYTGLPEKDVNMMLAILDQNGIDAERHMEEGNKYSLRVETSDFTKSVKILAAKGFPRKKFKSIADVFPNEGIVKTPFEQRARFIHALNQELSQSISDIEGVISARVHITLPETTRFGQTKEKPGAAVIVHHYSSKSMHGLKPKIKQLVAHSVSGVTYDHVTVILSPVDNVYGASFPYEKKRTVPQQQFVDVDKKKNDKGNEKDAEQHSSLEKTKRSHIAALINYGSSSQGMFMWLFILAGIVLAATSIYFWPRAKKNDS